MSTSVFPIPVDPGSRSRWGELERLYREELLDRVMPFWTRFSPDHEHGGYFTCLDRDGRVYDTDKFVWLQARQVWTLSMLHARVEPRREWLDLARVGADFLRRHGRDRAGRWYFSLTRDGRPLVQPYNIFADCFAALAFNQYGSVAGDEDARRLALETYEGILRRRDDPKGKYSKAYPGTRPLRGFSLPMILCNLNVELSGLLPEERVREATDFAVREVMDVFPDPSRGIIRENVGPDGGPAEGFDGRLVSPGHGIEATWFVMEIARARGDRALAERALEIALKTLEFAWDREFGGVYYFLDIEGNPPQQLEWNQKLWWVHGEALVALALGYRLTGRADALQWFDRVHEYTWARFPDPAHGEWYGYLDRAGSPLLNLKGGKWKGCFHVPRALYKCATVFAELKER